MLDAVFVVIPALNEEASLPLVLGDLRQVAHVIVCDNGSSGATAAVAARCGSTVVAEPQRGYLAACLRGLAAIDELVAEVQVQFRLREAMLRVWEANRQIQIYNTKLEELVAERTAEVVATRDVTVFALVQIAESLAAVRAPIAAAPEDLVSPQRQVLRLPSSIPSP